MNPAARIVGVRIALVLVVSAIGFALLHVPMRTFETHAASTLLRLIGAGSTHVVLGTSIQVFPAHHEPFRAAVTPSCSSLASLIAIGCLASLAPRAARARRTVALGAALAVVAAGNIVRIAVSIAVGLAAGRTSLVLFHDWVGSVFTFAYTLGGYILMLWLLLPDKRPLPEEALVAV